MSYREFLTYLANLQCAYLKSNAHLPRRSKYHRYGAELMEGSITQLRALKLRGRLEMLYQQYTLTWPGQ